MSDTYYREKAAKRRRIYMLISALVFFVLCIYLSAYAFFYDSCTASFDREPESIVRSYINYISIGNEEGVINCWKHQTYYELDAGCSDICLSRVLGTELEISYMTLDQPEETEDGRANLKATVMVTCSGGSSQHEGELILDGIISDLPWRHWKIIQSSVGGTISEPWCK